VCQTTSTRLGQSPNVEGEYEFDPISTKDYYALAGIFESSVVRCGPFGRDGSKAAAFLSLPAGGEAMGMREGIPTDGHVRIRGESKNLAKRWSAAISRC